MLGLSPPRSPSPRRPRPLIRAAAALLLVVQLVPASSPSLAGLGHWAFHLGDGEEDHPYGALGDAEPIEPDPVPGRSAADARAHVHGEDDRPHTHAPLVDALLSAARGGGGENVGPPTPGQQQVDDHVPPAEASGPSSGGARLAAALDGPGLLRTDAPRPPVPPPRG